MLFRSEAGRVRHVDENHRARHLPGIKPRSQALERQHRGVLVAVGARHQGEDGTRPRSVNDGDGDARPGIHSVRDVDPAAGGLTRSCARRADGQGSHTAAMINEGIGLGKRPGRRRRGDSTTTSTPRRGVFVWGTGGNIPIDGQPAPPYLDAMYFKQILNEDWAVRLTSWPRAPRTSAPSSMQIGRAHV